MDAALLDLMVDTVTISSETSYNGYGVPTYSAGGTQYPARVVDTQKQVVDMQGNEVIATSIAWVDSTGTMVGTEKVTLSDGSNPTIIRVERYPDEVGSYFIKLYFG